MKNWKTFPCKQGSYDRWSGHISVKQTDFKIKESDQRPKENFIKVKGAIHEEDNYTKCVLVHLVTALQST
jgi:hypothetical protein